MTNNQPTSDDELFRKVMNLSLRLLALSLLLVWCFKILEPFIMLLVWSSVLAVSLYPLQQMAVKKLKIGNKLSSALTALLVLLVIIVPAVMLMLSTVQEIKHTVDDYKAGNITVPPPPENVKEWPIIGSATYELWSNASNNVVPLIQDNREKLKTAAVWMINGLASTGKGLGLFALAIIISGFLLAFGKGAEVFTRQFFHRLSGNSRMDIASLAAITIRKVVKGILGVAFIQATLVCIGLLVAGIPAAGLWTLICLLLSIMQIGIFPVAIGVIIYSWNNDTTTVALLLTIWLALVSLVDNVLKPLLLGKGAPVPMLVIFLGAIGGFILSGFIGLFTGAVILSLGYQFFDGWMNEPAR